MKKSNVLGVANVFIVFLTVATGGFSLAANDCRGVFSGNRVSIYRTDGGGHQVGVKRIETLAGRAVEVLDVTDNVRIRRVKADPSLKIFDVSDVFAEDVPFIGFGKPNVYIGTTSPTGQPVKFAAKSLKRGDSEIIETRGIVQSGVLIVLKGLDQTAQARIFESAQKHEGSRRWTCVNANCRVLKDAGFELGNGGSLSRYYFPTPLLRDILAFGLKLNGENVEYDVVRTTPDYLETAGLSIDQAVVATPLRHTSRAIAPLMAKLNANTYFVRVKTAVSETLSLFVTRGEDAPAAPRRLEAAPIRLPMKPDLKTFDVEISEPSKFGTLLSLLWGPHRVFQVPMPSHEINQRLPETLKAFPHAKPSLMTKIKKHLIFSRPVVGLIRSQLAAGKRNFEGLSEKDLYDMLRTDSLEVENKYNLVVTGDSIIIMKVGIRVKSVDWVLSKHVLVSGYSNDVRFAGEIWKGADGKIHVNANSGTYMPTNEQLLATGELLQILFPNAVIEVHLH